MIVSRFAEQYPFVLDPFQLEAMEALSQGESVLVTAPTGSGKTLVAEFAIYDAFDRGLKVVYTTPLKALSNQKYRDLKEIFGEEAVGLVTGDVSVNPDAGVVVMTTEILRNILYQNPSRLDPVQYVILDEVHYMNDEDRGTVWEETIIHSPKHLHLVALSATVANAEELAHWISSIHGPVRVIEHHERAVPLEYHYFTGGRLERLLGKDGDLNRGLRHRRKTGRRPASVDPVGVIEELQANNLLPAISFIFSRKGCDQALEECLSEPLKLVTKAEKQQIQTIIERVVADNPSLKETGPSTNRVLAGLAKGLASHHAGLVPVLRGLVEELFQAGLVKAVFATETLAAGINMPARTTVINTLSKRTDVGHRLLTVSEFMQMTGRAGRRGKDVLGHCVVVDDEFHSVEEVFGLVAGTPDAISSHFTLSYNMVLNLLRTFTPDDVRPILRRSFGQYLRNQEIIDLKDELESQRQTLSETLPGDVAEDALLEYEHLTLALSQKERALMELRYAHGQQLEARIIKALGQAEPGQLVVFKRGRRRPAMVAALVSKRPAGRGWAVAVASDGGRLERITSQDILHISNKRSTQKRLDDDLAKKILEEARDRTFEAQVKQLEKEMADVKQAISAYAGTRWGTVDAHRHSHAHVRHLTAQIAALQRQIEEQQERYLEEFKRIMKVLAHYQHLDGDKPTLRGELNAHLRTTNGLLMSELILSDILDGLSAVETAAVISTLLYEPRRTNAGVDFKFVPKKVRHAVDKVYRLARDVEFVQDQNGVLVPINVEMAFVPLVLQWGKGAPWQLLAFSSKMDDGDIVRSMRQLIDLLHQIRLAPGVKDDLRERIELAIVALDRDLIAAAV